MAGDIPNCGRCGATLYPSDLGPHQCGPARPEEIEATLMHRIRTEGTQRPSPEGLHAQKVREDAAAETGEEIVARLNRKIADDSQWPEEVENLGEARPLRLTWRANFRDGKTHREWTAPCGCAYHPEPHPHVHQCNYHVEPKRPKT